MSSNTIDFYMCMNFNRLWQPNVPTATHQNIENLQILYMRIFQKKKNGDTIKTR